MVTEKGEGSSIQQAAKQHSNPTELSTKTSPGSSSSQPATPPKLGDDPSITTQQSKSEEKKHPVKRDEPSDSTSPSTPEFTKPQQKERQVIAVSASKGPAAFFNLARKFLVTDEECDLSALEGAIVSAVDAAHLLERSKLATIVRVQTSYVTVEPKRRKQVPSPQLQTHTHQSVPGTNIPSTTQETLRRQGSATERQLRRARIVITVRRTESYKRWLEENPLQAIIAGDHDDEEDEEVIAQGEP